MKSGSNETAEYARKYVAKGFKGNQIPDTTSQYPKFKLNEITVGKVLGKGGFGTVSEIRAFDVSKDADADDEGSRSNGNSTTRTSVTSSVSKNGPRGLPHMKPASSRSLVPAARSTATGRDDSEVSDGEMESRRFIAEHALRNNADARYAMKVLSPDVVSGDRTRHLTGIIDMAIETRFLGYLEHPNIIKMRALAKTDPFEEGYFIVLDRLYDTLEKRMRTWLGRYNRTSGLAKMVTDRKGTKRAALLEERLLAAFDLAAAVEHLHGNRIIYRDLKPENVGFDIRGDIKLFDFGLAKELCSRLRNSDGTYNLTENTGSMRYMAPEVASGKPYNERCDSYSFAILLWEIMALATPYEMYTPKSLREKVYNGPHQRPKIEESWSNAIKTCLKRSWAGDLHTRTSMAQVRSVLRTECIRVRGGDDAGLEHNRRRSTFVFRKPQKKTTAKKACPIKNAKKVPPSKEDPLQAAPFLEPEQPGVEFTPIAASNQSKAVVAGGQTATETLLEF